MPDAPSAQPDNCAALIAGLLAAIDPRATLHQYETLWQHPACALALAAALKAAADHDLHTNLNRARQWADLLFELATLSRNPLHRALGLRALGNILMIGEYNGQAAISHYDEAAALYRAADRPVEAAQSQVGKVGSLYFLGRYEEALALGEEARETLQTHQQWPPLTGLLLNMAAIHRRLGQGRSALALLDEARAICRRSGAEAELPGIELNRANVLCDLGQLPAAWQAGRLAETLFAERRQAIGVARAQVSQAIPRFQMGRYNQAMTLFDQARIAYMADARYTDALLVDRFASDLLLQIGRYADVIEKCAPVRARYHAHDIPYEVAQAIVNEAAAYAGLGQPELALHSLAEARMLLAGNPARQAMVDLETAVIFYQQGAYTQCQQTAVSCRHIFEQHRLPLRAAQAKVIAARAAIHLGHFEPAQQWLRQAFTLGHSEDIPWLCYQAQHLLGNLAQQNGRVPEALVAYDQAIAQLERLRGWLMIELRVDFLANKQQVYEDAVCLRLDSGQVEHAFQTAERARSRTLVDLLAHRLDLRLTARTPADSTPVAELQELRDRRNQLHRQWENSQDETVQNDLRLQIVVLEKQITARWQALLVRNADYARDRVWFDEAAVRVQPFLDTQTLLLSYFVAQGELIVFLVSRDNMTAHRLPGARRQLAQPGRLLNLNLKAMPGHRPAQTAQLRRGALAQLGRFYDLLIAPIADTVAAFPRLVIVPHGPLLHYLPFAALHNGTHFLIEQHQISHLPAASLLSYLPGGRQPAGRAAAFGFSANGRLPFAAQEATAVAQCLAGQAYIEEAATSSQLQTAAATASVLHLASHGDFNPENPLFSSLSLADGPLHTLDIFNLRLQASLVTLSACQTGRSVVSGGDELLGLMRAFLYAGAASLVLSLWRVHDEATLLFMSHFYQALAVGQSKAAALRLTQCYFLQETAAYTHPYYWAPFFLVGDTGQL